jgi:hypothetical protein
VCGHSHLIILNKGKAVFDTGDEATGAATPSGRMAKGSAAQQGKGQQRTPTHTSTEMDKLKLCKEDFDAAKLAFNNVR